MGVVGSIAPWNYPLQMAMWKVLPAIAAGNTIVLKPAELTPLTSLMFAEDAGAVGIPHGVVNVLTGSGRVVGEALVSHPAVRMVSFTGSTEVGRRVMELATGTIKRVHLELGGKAPFLVFDDADLEAAANGAVAGALINTGQDCTAATRAYVARPLFDAFVARVAELFATVRLGDPRDPHTDQGPLISVEQRDRVHGFVQRAVQAGARIVCGGQIPAGDLAAGSFYPPTLVVDAAQDSEIVQQELFGPVLVVLPFDSDDEGIALANDTPYGLAASAWTTNTFRAQRASRELQAGCVWINDHIPIVSEMPHGGYKSSGFGKDMSLTRWRSTRRSSTSRPTSPARRARTGIAPSSASAVTPRAERDSSDPATSVRIPARCDAIRNISSGPSAPRPRTRLFGLEQHDLGPGRPDGVTGHRHVHAAPGGNVRHGGVDRSQRGAVGQVHPGGQVSARRLGAPVGHCPGHRHVSAAVDQAIGGEQPVTGAQDVR